MANTDNRTSRLVILLTPAERSAIEAMATREHLPTSTMARKLLLDATSTPRTLVDSRVEYSTKGEKENA